MFQRFSQVSSETRLEPAPRRVASKRCWGFPRMHRMSRIPIFIAVFSMVLQIGAQQRLGSAGGSVEGTVIDKAADRPVQGVRLTVESQGFGPPQISAVTDSEGHFLFKDL